MKMRELFNVGFLASMNVGGGVVQTFLDGAEPILHFLIGCGQLSVAVVTIWYIVWKICSGKKNLKKE
jgi:hypothetical protein